MKIHCEKCGKEINQAVSSQISSYGAGKLVCPHCHQQNKRYISTFDLYGYALGCMLIYGLALLVMGITTAITNQYQGPIWGVFLISIVGVVFLMVGISRLGLYIYEKAPGKKAWATITMKEDMAQVTKKTRHYFLGFILLVFILGVCALFVSYWFLLIGMATYIVLFIVEMRKTYKQEKAYYEETFQKKKG